MAEGWDWSDAPHPPHVAEWEELLLRVEIAPRALRVAVEDAPAESPAVREALSRALLLDHACVDALDAMAAGGGVPAIVAPDAEFALSAPGGGRGAEELAADLAAVRARLFARVQRRGLEVWRWEGALPDGRRLTAWQLLLGVMRRDGATLDTVRGAAREAGAC